MDVNNKKQGSLLYPRGPYDIISLDHLIVITVSKSNILSSLLWWKMRFSEFAHIGEKLGLISVMLDYKLHAFSLAFHSLFNKLIKFTSELIKHQISPLTWREFHY